jgi:hypothetical protein
MAKSLLVPPRPSPSSRKINRLASTTSRGRRRRKRLNMAALSSLVEKEAARRSPS